MSVYATLNQPACPNTDPCGHIDSIMVVWNVMADIFVVKNSNTRTYYDRILQNVEIDRFGTSRLIYVD